MLLMRDRVIRRDAGHAQACERSRAKARSRRHRARSQNQGHLPRVLVLANVLEGLILLGKSDDGKMKMAVSAERLRNAEKAVADLELEVQTASPEDKPAVQSRLNQANERLEILRKSRILGM